MSFVIAYVPNVENVENIENVDVVKEVQQLPHPFFPNINYKYNFEYGGKLNIEANIGMYQAVYTPESNCEFKGIRICSTAYNVEDTIDVMIGSRYVIKGSHVKEMAEERRLELYEVVDAGTPIIIQYHNASGYYKELLFDIITLLGVEVINNVNTFAWNFDWSSPELQLTPEDTCNLVITQPSYVNLDSVVSEFTLDIKGLTTETIIAQVTCDSNGVVTSNYVETDPLYVSMGLLSRVNLIGIVDVVRFNKSIHVIFKNLSNTITHPIEISVIGDVTNLVNGG